jgi:hypothetical protein
MKTTGLLGVLALGGCFYGGYRDDAVLPAGPPVARDEIERLAAAGISEPVIVELLEKRGARPFSADDLVALKTAGVTDGVVQKALSVEVKQPETIVVEQPVSYSHYHSGWYDPWYYHRPYLGFGFGYSRWHRSSGLGVRIYR